jgi:hypothetical protein
MNDLAQCLPTPHQIGRCELALEDRELKMIPKPAHQLEDFP